MEVEVIDIRNIDDINELGTKIAASIKRTVRKQSIKSLLEDHEFVAEAKEYAFLRIRISYLKDTEPEKYSENTKILKEGYLPKDKIILKVFLKIAREEYERLKADPTSEYEN